MKPTSLFSLILLVFLSASCITYKDVELKGTNGFNVDSFSKEEVRLRLTVTVENPNNYNIKVKKGDLDLFVSGKKAGKAKLAESIVLRKNETADYDVVVITSLKELGSGGLMTLAGGALSGSIPIRVKGWVKAKAFGIGKKFEIDERENVRLTRDMMNGMGF